MKVNRTEQIYIGYNESISNIVMGHNEGWKQRTNMDPVNNQKFVQIPFNTLISMVRYKAEKAGIRTIVIDESHTSKSSFLDVNQLNIMITTQERGYLKGYSNLQMVKL